jgi:hypothetical protein
VDLIDVLLSFPAALAVSFGIALAALVHWLAPSPEPVLLEAGLVALGFLGSLIWGYSHERRRE